MIRVSITVLFVFLSLVYSYSLNGEMDDCCKDKTKVGELICALKNNPGKAIILFDSIGVVHADEQMPFLFLIVEFHRNYKDGTPKSISTPLNGAKVILNSYNEMGGKSFKDNKVIVVEYKGKKYCSSKKEYLMYKEIGCLSEASKKAIDMLYAGPDIDGDGVPDKIDICRNKPNKNQEDTDKNGIGDACEFDLQDDDFDGIPNKEDNCPTTTSNNKKDSDGDGLGDACDDDIDDDGKINWGDNCPTSNNPYQEDSDGDNIGDACDNRDDLALETEVYKAEAHFETDKYNLYKYSTDKLDSIVVEFNKCKNCFISLLGFADNPGSVNYNLRLSEKRIMKVKLYLIDEGIPPAKIHSEYFGELGDGKRNERKVEVILFMQ